MTETVEKAEITFPKHWPRIPPTGELAPPSLVRKIASFRKKKTLSVEQAAFLAKYEELHPSSQPAFTHKKSRKVMYQTKQKEEEKEETSINTPELETAKGERLDHVMAQLIMLLQGFREEHTTFRTEARLLYMDLLNHYRTSLTDSRERITELETEQREFSKELRKLHLLKIRAELDAETLRAGSGGADLQKAEHLFDKLVGLATGEKKSPTPDPSAAPLVKT